jgi:hypothetical protein
MRQPPGKSRAGTIRAPRSLESQDMDGMQPNSSAAKRSNWSPGRLSSAPVRSQAPSSPIPARWIP